LIVTVHYFASESGSYYFVFYLTCSLHESKHKRFIVILERIDSLLHIFEYFVTKIKKDQVYIRSQFAFSESQLFWDTVNDT